MQSSENRPVTPSALASARDLAAAKQVGTVSFGSAKAEVVLGPQSLWVIAVWGDGSRVGVRTAFASDGSLEVTECGSTDGSWKALLNSEVGQFTVELQPQATPSTSPTNSIMRITTVLAPVAPLKIPYWPRDLMPLDHDLDPFPTRGTVHFHQRGPRTGMLYASVDSPSSGAFLYFQNLTALNGYCQAGGASVSDAVGGEWPELGFGLPATQEPLTEGEPVTISDVFLALGEKPEGDAETASRFLDLLGQVYLSLPRPVTAYRDWPGAVRSSLKDLRWKGCWSDAGGNRYLNAYVGDTGTPPESMVQLAVLVPMIEYSEWSGRKPAMVDVLRDGLGDFFDEKIGAIGRWHPAVAHLLKGEEDHKQPRVMDSWYLYHPLLNLARLALRGDDGARRLFLDSLPYVIGVAHHFRYRWPVLYNIDTLEVVRAETAPGEGGEHDVAGLHASLMIQAWKLTDEKTYLDEAKAAAESLRGLGFKLAYQMNNTLFTAGALLTLFQESGDPEYLELTEICLANVFTNVFLWECDYGTAINYPTFFGLFPLNDAPYTAAYEEIEAMSALDRYLRDSGDDLSSSLRILIPEMIRYLLNKGLAYYPPLVDSESLADKQAVGRLDPSRWLPLEDLYEGREAAGQVGQEIYGAGSAFGMVVRHYWPVRKWGLMIYCDYPVDAFAVDGDTATFKILGDQRFQCEIRLIPIGAAPLPIATLQGSNLAADRGSTSPEGHRVFVAMAGQTVAVKVSESKLRSTTKK